jgi:predicted RNase H-like nuclease (RuvC/YqgF family)
MEIPSPEGTYQTGPHIEVNSHLEQTKQLEETGEQSPTDQEDLEIPHKQKKTTGKHNNKIKKLKQENNILRKKVKRIKVLKQKVGKLKETIRQLRKQLEQADKAHKKKKSKRPRIQGRNPLPRRTIQTNSVGTQTKLQAPLETTEIETQTKGPIIEEITFQTEGVFPTDFPAPLGYF